MKLTKLLPGLLVLFASLTLLISCNEKPRTITVQGEGVVSAVPDNVQLTVSVKHVESRMEDSAIKTRAVMKEIMALGEKFKVAPADIKTSNLSLDKEYAYIRDINTFVGYSSRQTTNILIRNIADFEMFSQELLALRINSIDGLVFQSSKINELINEANLLALDEAGKSAAAIAGRVGQKPGKILMINSTDSYVNDNGMDNFAGEIQQKRLNYSGVVLSPGIIQVKQKVLVLYELL